MDFEKYKNKMDYSQRPCSPVLRGKDAVAYRKYADELEVYELEIKVWREKREAYDQETGRLGDLFRVDLLEELGITGHPKADKLYEMAYNEGHSEGYNGIYHAAEAMVELLWYNEEEIAQLKIWVKNRQG